MITSNNFQNHSAYGSMIGDLKADQYWRIFRISHEFTEGFEQLTNLPETVSIFGSARLPADSYYYQTTVELAERLSQQGFAIMSGGGPGIMEAANRGTHDVGAASIGLNMSLPHEQFPNPYMTPGLALRFHYFAMRKMHFAMRAKAIVAFPGGYGTLDEVFEVLTLCQTGKSTKSRIILFDSHYWNGIINFDGLVQNGMITEQDRDLVVMVETAEEAWALIG